MAERSTGQKVFIGCGVAAVVLVMLGIGSCVAFVTWLGRPGESLRGERLLGPETDGYVEWTLRLEDPGTEQAVDTLFAAFREAQRKASAQHDNGFLRWAQDTSRQRNERQFRELFPVVLVWCSESGESGGADHLFAASLNAAGNRFVLLDWILGSVFRKSGELDSYRDERIYRIGGKGFSIFLSQGSLYVGSTGTAARRAVDRLSDPVGDRESVVRSLLREVPSESPLRGAFRNEQGGAVALLSTIGLWPEGSADAERLGAAMRNVLLRGGFDDKRALAGELRFTCESPGCDAMLRSLAGKELLPEGATSRSLRLVEADGARGRIEFRVEEPVETLGRYVESVFGPPEGGAAGEIKEEGENVEEGTEGPR